MKPNGSNLKIALQRKGRLASDSLALLKSLGLDFEFSEGRLFSSCHNFPLDLLFLRDDDIPEYVQDGVADLGIAGENVIREKGADVCDMDRLGFGYCALTLAVPGDSAADSCKALNGKRIATSYPNILRRFLDSEGLSARIIEISGSVEIAPTLDVADAICDLVSTGSTLKMNGLRPIHTVLESQALLIANPESVKSERKGPDIFRLRNRIQSHLRARNTKYVMMNAPSSSLPEIQATLPGMKSPTVMPLADKDMIAVHCAVPEGTFWDIIENLKKAGARDILVLPVEKIVI